MSLSKNLLRKAAEIRASSATLVAVDLLKQAGVSEEVARMEVAQTEMEKSAAVTMSQTGIDYDEALKLVKNAGIKLTEMANYQPTKSVEEELWESLTKMASEAKVLEDELETIRTEALGYSARVESLEKVAERREDSTDPVARLAQSGDFTNADLEALLKLGPETLTKVASMADQQQPWAMGRVSGQGQAEPMDALEAFCLGGNGGF